VAWSLIAFAELQAAEWQNAYGQRIQLKTVAAFGLRVLQQATDGLMPFFQAGGPLPQKMPIHGFTCGGTHLCYSLLVAARHGFIEAASWPLLRQQLDLLIYRLRPIPSSSTVTTKTWGMSRMRRYFALERSSNCWGMPSNVWGMPNSISSFSWTRRRAHTSKGPGRRC